MDAVPFDPSKPFTVVSGGQAQPNAAPAQPSPMPQAPQMLPGAQQPLAPQQTPHLTAAANPQQQQVPFDPSKPFQVVSDPQSSKAPGMALGITRAAAEGVPVLGGLVPKGIAAAKTALGYGAGNYRDELKAQNEEDEAFRQQHPYVATAANIGGGVASMLPLGATGIGARLLGLTGSLPGMIARGAASGAAIGSADALTRDQDPDQGALYGAAGGAAGPILGRAAEAIASPVAKTVRGIINPAGEAARNVAGAIGYDARAGQTGLTDAQFAANPAARVIDLGGEGTRALARSAANTSPEGRSILNNTINDRFEGQSARYEDWINSRFNYPNAAAQQRAIEETAQDVNNTRYNLARQVADQRFPNGIWADQHPEIARLISSPDVRSAMQEAANMQPGMQVAQGGGGFTPTVSFDNGVMKFNKGGGPMQFPDLNLWDLTYRNLRDSAQSAFRAGLNTKGSSLQGQAVALRNALDTLVPEFGQARSGARFFNEASNALEAGQNFARDARPDVDGARQAIADMSDQERGLFQDGFMSQQIENARNSGDRRNFLATIDNTPNKRAALDLALGPRANDLRAYLGVEGIMDAARGAVQGNSTTARQLVELGLAGGAGGLFDGSNPLTDPEAFIHSALVYGALRGRSAINERVARQVAGLLASRNIGAVRRGMQLVSRSRPLLSSVQDANAAFGAIGTRAVAQTAAARQGQQ